MEAYTDFAGVYDIFMEETPYEKWCEQVHRTLKRYGIAEGLVLDLGCGTGTLTELLASKGYDMIGVDNSQEMLNRAIEKRDRSGHDILYLCQDMRFFELYGTVKAVVCLCDSINYITEPEELASVFALVNNYLDPGGIFFFDFNTDYKYREVIGDTVIAENREHCSFIWENYYHEKQRINEYDVTVFEEEKSGKYRKYTETHYHAERDQRSAFKGWACVSGCHGWGYKGESHTFKPENLGYGPGGGQGACRRRRL